MKSKVLAAKKVTAFGIPYIIAPGRRQGVLQEIVDGKETGTLFLPMADHLKSRKYWIAFTLRARGRLVIDGGAKEALVEEGKSLLPSGVTQVEGDFVLGDPVTCVDAGGKYDRQGACQLQRRRDPEDHGAQDREDRAGPRIQGLR